MARSKPKSRPGGRRKNGQDTSYPLYRGIQSRQTLSTIRQLTNTIPIAALDSGFAVSFAVAQLPDYASLISNFDAYCLDKVEVTFNMTAVSGAQFWPCLYLAADYNDITLPATIDDLQVRGDCVAFQFGNTRNSYTRSIVPVLQTGAYQGVLTAYNQARPRTWVSTQYPSVYHYGLKYWLRNYNSTLPGQAMEVHYKFHLRLSGVK